MMPVDPSRPRDRLKLLCVEADVAQAEALRRRLAQELPTGSVFVWAGSLREALAEFAAGGDGIDAVLLNPELPDSQGFATLESLREPARHAAMIVLAERDDEAMAEKAMECGAQEYLHRSEVAGRALAPMVRHAVRRKAAGEARFESEARFHTLTDVVPQVIWTNEPGGKADYFNRRWFEYSGLDFAGSVGLGWQAMVHPEDAPASKERWDRALATGEIFDTEYRLRRADGMYRWHLGRNVPLKNPAGRVLGWFGTATDIHDLKETEVAFAATQERLRLILESADEHAIVSLDRERRVTSWNSGAAALTGYPAGEMIGQPMDLTFLPEDRAEGLPEMEAATALALGRASCDRWRVRKDGSLFWATCALLPMRARPGGEIVGFVNILNDQTKVQRARHQLEQSHAELQTSLQETERARAAAEAADRAKDHFLAVLSHELRTPLTPVLMAIHSLLHRTDLPPPVQKALAMIRRNVELEVHFIDEMLDLTRLSQGKMELVCAPMDLHEAIRRAVEVSEPDIQGKAQRLEIRLEAPRHTLQGDFARLQQVFWNLLKNAAKFTPEGGEIRLRTRSAGPEEIEVEITDSGIGMEAGTLEKVFQPFEQADTSIAQQFGGLGLGLAIAKASVDAHGGTIRAASAGQGQGATFTVTLPVGPFSAER